MAIGTPQQLIRMYTDLADEAREAFGKVLNRYAVLREHAPNLAAEILAHIEEQCRCARAELARAS